ncbi:hypothetical protein P280DRAFT_444719 [Massarina eburnea CBS 473.64]|uniref:BTB domain-containing protein n=1 Tax=Massarina eburnea CBS 473.64 TaxID=1395130 RepID=A0A6A6S8X3_9PLEO|nr:hypothetical protein P280DRAFT_444719 [Massarina eburnea CBS 473.64]
MEHNFIPKEPSRSRESTSNSDEPLAKRSRLSIEDGRPLSDAATSQSTPPPNPQPPVKEQPTAMSSQMPFTTTITLEYGENLSQNCTIHLSCLAERSPYIKTLFAEAEYLQQRYEVFKSLRRKIKALLPPETPFEAFVGTNVDEMLNRAMPLIVGSFNKFPLAEYQKLVRHEIISDVDEMFQKNQNMNEINVKRKDYPSTQIAKRLNVMKASVVHTVLNQLLHSVMSIKRSEETAALKDSMKAAAQRRIVLYDCDQETVGSVMQWIYKGTLEFADADHLCKIQTLAVRLGMVELDTICVDKLVDATRKDLENAEATRSSVSDLLEAKRSCMDIGVQADPLAEVVRVVFLWVLQHKTPPVKLKEIVVEAIADSADSSLVDSALSFMDSNLTGELCTALVGRHWKRHGDICVRCAKEMTIESKLKIEKEKNKGE